MDVLDRIPIWLGAPALASLLMISIWSVVPAPLRHDLQEVRQDAISLLTPGLMSIPMQPEAADRIAPISENRQWKSDLPRQFSFSLTDKQPQTVLVPALGGPGRIWINGMPLEQAVNRTATGPGTGHARLVADLPPDYLKFESNRADIVVESDTDRIGLPAVYLGSPQAVAAAAQAIERWDRWLAGLTMLASGVGVISALAGLTLRRNRLHQLGGLLISLVLLGYAARHAGGSGILWQIPSLTWAIAALIGSFLFGWGAWTGSGASRLLHATLAITALVAALIGIFMLNGTISPQLPTAGMANVGLLLAPLLGGPIILLGDVKHYLGALALARTEIAEQQAIITRQEAELAEQVRVKTIVEERQRFVRDMHDGVGGHLLSLLMRVRTKNVELGEVEGEIQRGIDDLRLVADSLDNVGTDLDTALTSFRSRARQQLDAAGITFDWKQTADLSAVSWDARQILNLYRLLQEALANAVRHSGASAYGVELLQVDAANWRIVMSDNGKGFDLSSVTSGKGIGNMCKRASALGGTVSFLPGSTGGTRIELTLPMVA